MTTLFSVINALLLRGLPFRDPGSLVELRTSPVPPLEGRSAFTAWQARSLYLEGAAGFTSSEMNLTGRGDALRVKVAETSANFFQLLGAGALLGRTFAAGEDAAGHAVVAVISHSLWQQRFGGSPGVTGATLELNGGRVTVIGVAPPRFDYPGKTDVWTSSLFSFETMPKQGAFVPETIGRLKPGIAIQQARALSDAEFPPGGAAAAAPQPNRAGMVSLREQLAGSVSEASWILFGLMLLVLLTACANVAQLLLSRTTERRQELAIRAAMGASRGRLLQQLTTEAVALTAAGAALGLLVARWAVEIAASVAPAQLADQKYTILDWRVIGFATALAILTGLVFGVLPAWMAGQLHPTDPMIRSRVGSPSRTTKRMRTWLAAMQAALTIALLASSAAMGRTFLNLLDTDLGLRPANVVSLSVSLQGSKYRTGVARRQYYRDALDRLRDLPGVQSAGAIGYLPLGSHVYMSGTVKLDSGQSVTGSIWNAVMSGYFQTVGTNLLAGRDFDPAEAARPERGVIVNQAFASAAGLDTAIVGRLLKAPWREAPYVIVGLVPSTRLAGPSYPADPQVFWPTDEEPPPALTFVAKVDRDAGSRLAAAGSAIRALDREVAIYDLKTLDQRLSDVLARPRFYTTAIVFLAAFALLLAAVGAYGNAAYSVAQRKHEMGLRMALGASHQGIRALVVRENLIPLAAGMVAGIAAAAASGRFLDSLVVYAQPIDLAECVAGAAVLLLAGFAALWTATTSVLAIAPADALRAE